MSNKPSNLHQHSYAIMIKSDNEAYQQMDINEEENMSDSDYDRVVINEDGSDLDDYEDNEVQEIYDTDMSIEQTSSIWGNNAIRYLIYCWSQLRDQFVNCPETKKKALWQLVSEHMVDRGFYFDAVACENKWRGLKKVYTFNKTQSTKNDQTKHIIVWSHYYDMDRAIKGIAYELSDMEDDLRDCAVDSCITTIGDYENIDSMNGYIVDKCHWTIKSTKELIRLYGKERKRFSATNQGSKHLLWEEISQQMSQMGYHYSANLCDDKWRNLKMSYKNNKLRALKYGAQHIKWLYFKDLDDIFKHNPHESPDLNELITVSISEDSSLMDGKKDDTDNFDDNIDFRTTEINAATQNSEINDGDGQSSSLEVWTEAATKQLIQLWGLFRSRFLLAAQGKKRLLWNEISDQLRQNGHNYSGVVCDRKWRLLKANYLKRKEKYKKLGVNNIKWQYYHDLDRLLGVPIETVAWSMDSTMCLIDSFNRHKEKFLKAATGEKLLIWRQISEEMMQNGYSYSPRACDNKWRTLKNRYNKNKMRANRNKKIIWVYYDKLHSVLGDSKKEKTVKNEENENCEINSHENENHEEHNYIRISKPECSIKPEAISELKDMFKLRNEEFDLRLKQMEENLNNRETLFESLQHQTLDALKRSNELETQKLKLLEQLVSRLPPSSL